jgi:nitrite reductase/ring-hydroxylating ferredoxin subunit
MPGARHVKLGGYLVRPATSEDAALTHVGRDTPAGELLRRYWQPIAIAGELGDVPLAVRVLGEELVLFRDLGGRLGLLHRACPHRGAPLDLGVLTERGLRCCYHGWLFDVDGTILETPAEPDPTRARDVLCHGAYPVREHGGLIFAYLGPPGDVPELPIPDTWLAPDDNELVPFKLLYPCNWLQVHENTADPLHIPFLHGRGQFSPGFAELPALSVLETAHGLVIATTRCAAGRIWMRSADVLLPNVAQYPPAYETGEAERLVRGAWVTRWIVPLDDTRSWVIGVRHFNRRIDPNGQGRREEIGVERIDFAGQTAAPPERRQRDPGDYEAMVGQGPIAIHANEHLVASDRGVVALRRQLRRASAAVCDGLPLPRPPVPVPTFTCEVVLPAASTPGPAELRELGDRALRVLVDGGAEIDVRLREALQCP